MSGGQPADEVAEDYKASLEYLTNNDRYAINNFTVIAKENTEHADAISNVLVAHIGKARPDHKLPALYVLDSIAKNIGTPYTLFLGHKLYTTFMDAYSKVDRPTRKKLDEMLKTWKSPVPGSIDSRPVFPIEITRKIENALIQAKTRAIEVEQQQQRSQQELFPRRVPSATPSTQWRNTPTPPQNHPRFHPPSAQALNPSAPPNGHIPRANNSPYPQFAQFSTPQNGPLYQPPLHPPNAYPVQAPPPENLDSLHRDIEDLIRVTRADFAQNLTDQTLGIRLKALLDLQSLLQKQQLPHDQIQAVRKQVSDLQASKRWSAQIPQMPAPSPTPPQPMISTPMNINAISQPPYQPPPSVPAPTPASAQPTNLLASLLASVERSKQAQTNNSPLPVPLAPPPQQSVPPVPQPMQAPASVGGDLIAKLRASGLLNASATPNTSNAAAPNQGPPAPLGGPSAAAQPTLNLSDLLRKTSVPSKKTDVELTSASLKIPRPHLISKLYEARPNQCLSCGKRFLATEEGKSQKARHLDWHFRTNQRIAELAQRGQSRSWYVDELEWIKFRGNEEDVDDSTAGGKEAQLVAAEVKNDPKNKFIPVPNDSSLASLPCGICQEKFEPSWKESLQDFVWMDAIVRGGRVFHASCYADFQKDGGRSPGRTSTPDSVLGKRKAEAGNSNPSRIKARRESAD